MQIRYFATIREITGQNTITWAQPANTLGDLLRQLTRRYDSRFAYWVWKGDKLSDMVIILVNGGDVRHLTGLDTPLNPDDIISIFPMVAGG